jgi:hypothetical protein
MVSTNLANKWLAGKEGLEVYPQSNCQKDPQNFFFWLFEMLIFTFFAILFYLTITNCQKNAG